VNDVIDLSVRDVRPEIMDGPDLPPERHRAALAGLARINRFSTARNAIWHSIATLGKPLRVLDLACGGGDLACDLKQRAKRRGLAIRVAGCDRSETALAAARERSAKQGLEIDWFEHDVICGGLPSGYDVLTCSLFLHHLETSQAEQLLRRMHDAAGSLGLVCDLLRTRAGFALARLGTRLLSRSPVVHHDGPLSVRAAFTAGEVRALCDRAGVADYRLSGCWPQRFLLSFPGRSEIE
jgi:2-polyprenyl-3-methyl-5-hydroxy-6-metoxy-1,4-benzoquinol methylase